MKSFGWDGKGIRTDQRFLSSLLKLPVAEDVMLLSNPIAEANALVAELNEGEKG